MNKIIIRKIESADFPQIKTIIKETWDMSDAIESQET